MSQNLNDLFPQLTIKQQHFFSQEQFEVMPYFKQLSVFMSQAEVISSIKKSKKLFQLLSLKKGTIIYTNNMPSTCGYLLCHGAVKLLIKKNNRQKLQTHPRHILHQPQERISFLNQMFSIPPNKCEQLFGQFYEQKVFFKFIEYETLYGQGYFGFSDMIRNNNRNYMAIATQDTILLQLDKSKFQGSLKQVQIKKQEFIIKSILENVTDYNKSSRQNSDKQTESVLHKQISIKMSQIFNYFMIRSYQKDQKIFVQNQACKCINFILRGQVQLKKTLKIDMPKKLIKNQNKPQIDKQLQIKVSRLSQKCYLGQAEFFFNNKTRQFTAIATQNNTMIIKIEPMSFLKIIGEFSSFERELIVSAKQKYLIANQNYLKQKNKVVKAFIQEVQLIENKKKERIIGNFLEDDQNHKNPFNQTNSTTFQIFSKQGVFYRDTYQKLQGFQQFETNQANNKRAAIKKYRIQTNNLRSLNKDQKQETIFIKHSSQHQSKALNDHQQGFQTFGSKEKLLYSPKKNLNVLDFMASAPISPQKSVQRSSFTSQNNSLSKNKRRGSLDKFHQLKKDQAVFKRVLIKNGRFQQDKTTYKSNIVQPIVHPKFDQIIKQCMSRKNQVIRRAIGQKQNNFVKDSYTNTISALKNKSLSISKFSNVSLTCKGTEEFKKKLQFLNKNQQRKSDSLSGLRNRVAIQQENLQACIGVNQPPKSSYQKRRIEQQEYQLKNKKFMATYSGGISNNKIGNQTLYSQQSMAINNRSSTAFISKKQSPQKLVLLNHMMKPITYSSVQF